MVKKAKKLSPFLKRRAEAPANAKTRVKAKPKPAKVTAKPAPKTAHSQTGNFGTVALHFGNETKPLNIGRNIERAAMQWTYVVRSRQRWATTRASEQAARASELLNDLGVDNISLTGIARAGLVEVSIEWTSEDGGWATRILPWEYVLAGATRSHRNDQPLTVIRHLNTGARRSLAASRKRVLFVVCEPGPLQRAFTFNSERKMVKSSLRVHDENWRALKNPTEGELEAEIREFEPDFVHLAGFDNHHARSLLLDLDQEAAARFEEMAASRPGSDEIRDGYVLAGPGDELNPIQAERLGKILTAGNRKPHLVAMNIGNSAARIAPILVASGVDAAIGFQDNFDDQLAEFFFSVFYSRIAETSYDVSQAFQVAWERVRAQASSSREGSGVVLWNARSQFEKNRKKVGAAAKADSYPPIDAQEVAPNAIGEWLRFEIEEKKDLNYSMLHNQRPLFDKFFIHSQGNRTIRNVEVEVALSTGTDSTRYQCVVDVVPPSFDLSPHIHVPLTSSITRSIHESVRTSLFIQVTWGDHLLYRQTKRVRLTPVDQWRDSETDRIWLPSFVFPRDNAVSELVDTAQRYVRVLRDDPAAGFDGYQSFDPESPEPAAEVDLQVQAIWSAIVHELRLGYINPPPGYSNDIDSQRLRTPTMVARYHSGTCIDLTLFLAACLELVDVYPVIFLLSGHAFPGYWRSSDYHDEFVVARPDAIQDIMRADSHVTGVYGAQKEPWFLGKPTYREITQLVNDGKLVPLETVRLTENCGFWEAVDAGKENLRAPHEFEAMVDIALAREKQVTPLPILGEQI